MPERRGRGQLGQREHDPAVAEQREHALVRLRQLRADRRGQPVAERAEAGRVEERCAARGGGPARRRRSSRPSCCRRRARRCARARRRSRRGASPSGRRPRARRRAAAPPSAPRVPARHRPAPSPSRPSRPRSARSASPATATSGTALVTSCAGSMSMRTIRGPSGSGPSHRSAGASSLPTTRSTSRLAHELVHGSPVQSGAAAERMVLVERALAVERRHHRCAEPLGDGRQRIRGALRAAARDHRGPPCAREHRRRGVERAAVRIRDRDRDRRAGSPPPRAPRAGRTGSRCVAAAAAPRSSWRTPGRRRSGSPARCPRDGSPRRCPRAHRSGRASRAGGRCRARTAAAACRPRRAAPARSPSTPGRARSRR